MNAPKAKSLITGEKEPINEAPGEGMPPGGPGGPPRRPMRPGGPPRREAGPGGPDGPSEPGGLTPQEKIALKDLVILDLVNMLGNSRFAEMVAQVGLGTAPISGEVVRHFMDEAGKYADKMSPQVNELMGKIAKMPTQ